MPPENTHAGTGRYSIAICGMLVTIYLAGVTLHPTLEKVGQVGLLLWSVGFLFTRPWRRAPAGRWALTVMAVFALFFLSALFSHWAGAGGYEGGKMLGRYARFLLVIPLFFLFRRFASGRWLFWGAMAALALNSAWAVIEYSGWGELPVGDKLFPDSVNASLNPIQYGSLILCLTLLLLAGQGIYRSRGRFWIILMWLLAGLGLAAMFASGARGAMITLPLLAMAGLWIGLRNRGLGHTPLILLLVTVLAYLPSHEQIGQRAQMGVEEAQGYEEMQADKPTSVGTRLHMWQASVKIFMGSPWLGVGPGNYEAEAQKLHDRGEAHPWAVYNHPHSEYFSVLATRGLLGLASLGLLFMVPLLYFWRHVTDADLYRRAAACAGVMIVLELGQAGLTESVFRLSSTMGFYIFAVALLAAILSRVPNDQTTELT